MGIRKADAQARKYEGTEREVRRIFKKEKRWKKKPEGKFGSKTKRPSREGKMAGGEEIASAVVVESAGYQSKSNPSHLRATTGNP